MPLCVHLVHDEDARASCPRIRHAHTSLYLREPGVTRLFLHQARAINAAMAGQHIAIATATSSGKSVVYNTPVLQVRTYGSVGIVWDGSGKVTEQRIITYIHTLTNTRVFLHRPTKQTILANAAHGVPARALYLFPTKALAQVHNT